MVGLGVSPPSMATAVLPARYVRTLLLQVALQLAACGAGVNCQQLSATVAIDRPFALGASAGPHALLFKPAGSHVAVDLPDSVLLPDVPGEYVVRGSDNDTQHIEAVDLVRWAADMQPIMSDTFGANDVPTDSASGSGFWNNRLIDQTVGECGLHEMPGVGLRISTGGGPCGLRTRNGCPQMGDDPAVTECGFASGATSVNPFNDRLIISLGNVTLGSAAAGAVRLTNNETKLGAIELGFNTTTAVIRWTSQTKTGTQDEQIGNAVPPTPQWIELQSQPIQSCGETIGNISMSIAIKQARLSYACFGKNGTSVFIGTWADHAIDWRSFAPSSAGELALSIRVTQGQVTLRRFEVASLRGHGHLRAQLAPIPNLNGWRSPFLGDAHSPHFAALGYLDVTKPPFEADATGQRDSTAALQAAINYCRRNYLTVFLPSGLYLVSKTLVAKQTQRLDAVDGSNNYWQQARYVPNRIVGSTRGDTKPTIVLAPGSFTDATRPQPVVWLWMQNNRNPDGPFDSPFDGTPQPNANCNQIFQGIDIRITQGNAGAVGIRARGAQMMVVQDVTIFAGNGLVGLSGGSGSGGSHYGVTVVGGKYGVDFTTAQPGPVISGFTLENQTCSALIYAGLQTLTAVGLRIRALVPMAQPAIVAGCDAATNMVPTWQGKLFHQDCKLEQFANPRTVQPCQPLNSGPLSLVDSIVELGQFSRQPVAIATAASLYLHNVWVGGATTLVDFYSGGILPSPGMPWAEVQEYAKGISQTNADPDDPERGVSFTSRVHFLAARDLTPLARGNVNVTATELVIGLRTRNIGPRSELVTQHLYSGVPARLLPSFESTNAVFATGPRNACGASSDGIVDNAEALQKCIDIAARKSPPGVVVLGRGIYRISRTLILPPDVSLVGAGLHLTSLVPTSAGFEVDTERTARGAGTALLRTVGGATMVAGLSLSPWAHYDTVSAVEWGAGEQSLWMQNHVNRMTECGISGGTPLSERSRLGPVKDSNSDIESTGITRLSASMPIPPPCKMHVKLNVPLALITGSGAFYNMYNEDAMGSMVAGDYQLPNYRHFLVNDTSQVRFYHFNPEHSVANANAEFRKSSNIYVYGTKSEGHSATIWVRDCDNIFHSGHAGNAAPEQCDPETCPTWKPSPCACNWTSGVPSLFRVEGCRGNCRFGNLWSQTTTATSSVWLAAGEASMATTAWDRPAVVATSETLDCIQDGNSIHCEHK